MRAKVHATFDAYRRELDAHLCLCGHPRHEHELGGDEGRSYWGVCGPCAGQCEEFEHDDNPSPICVECERER